ncbi:MULTISPECIES: PEP-CTERM sorting domain-containing protein [Corallincola]|uniref:PEP-CTERM sorting domain-containing protein n=3 Tax=Corallincola TaxID=1775176 RepID=A0A368NUL3_9GAMM|nr:MULTISPECIES: PEP-CTERM sorting domain-containing protein [Corallincola]RCU52901.1 PEP-CTERM sorting domain-containing protein [Corallincola holothuriorum]TAA47945.1 PEP-CTERM sorting domain-containing protein [Corallincola spongiicola]TCI03397.1 PEP-CTERM sorting domain-containing protein [Corallincola luteus]
MKNFVSVLSVLLLTSWAGIAHAGLMGATVGADFYYPNDTSLYCSNGTKTVDATVEYPTSCSGFSVVSIDVSDTQVIVGHSGNSFASGSFNGFVLSVLSDLSITSLMYDAAASTLGVTSYGFDASSAYFNFAGQLNGTAIFDINSSTNAAVPAPASIALIALVIAAMGWHRKQA